MSFRACSGFFLCVGVFVVLFDEFVACFLRCLAFGFGGLIWTLDFVA